MRLSRCLLGGIFAAVVMTAGCVPLWAGDIVMNFPIIFVDGDQSAIRSDAPLIFTTAMDDSNLTFADADQRLVIDTPHGVKFDDGVNVTQDMGQIEFHGDVTFNLNGPDSNLKLSELAFVGSDGAEAPIVLTVNNDTLFLGTETKLIIDKNLKVDFNALGNINLIPHLYLGENDDTTLSFADATVLTAAELVTGSLGHRTVIDGSLHIGTGGAPVQQGLHVTESITVNGDTTLDGVLSGGGGTNFIFGGEASFRLAEGAAGSVLAPNTTFTLSRDLLSNAGMKDVPVAVFKPFDTTDNASEGLMDTYRNFVENMALDDSDPDAIRDILDGGEIVYDKDSGYVVFANYGDRAALDGVPDYGVPYVNALDAAEHKALAIAIKGAAKTTDVSGELNTLMGNVPNAAVSAALSGSLNQVTGRLNSVAEPAGTAGGLWITPGYSLAAIAGSPLDGYGDVEIKNPHVVLGYDRWMNDRFRPGVFAALGRPESEGDNETIKTDSLQAGLYAQVRLDYGINVNAAAAYSRQSHDAKRAVASAFLPGYEQTVTAGFDGDALSGAVEISRLYRPAARNSFIRPAVAYTYVSAGVDGYEEKSDIANQGNSLAQRVDATDFTMHLLRAGAEGGWSNGLTTVTGRLFWMGNMGDARPETRARLIRDGSVPFTLTGAAYDKNIVNIGLGVQYAPPRTKGLTLGVNYDALLGSNTKSHTMNLMMRYEF